MENKLSASEMGREGAEQRAKELAEKNSRICSELEEISELVKRMEREKELAENKLKESIELLQVDSIYALNRALFSIDYCNRYSVSGGEDNTDFFIGEIPVRTRQDGERKRRAFS